MSLPFDQSYTPPIAGNKGYFKPTDENTKIRIMKQWITWHMTRDKTWERPRPIRSREVNDEIFKYYHPKDNPIKHFRAFIVYDFTDKTLKIREITQKSIQDAITSLCGQEDRGNMLEYSINVYKKGKDMETRYFVTPCPDKWPSKEADEMMKDCKINLEALYSWEDPFTTSVHEQKEDLPF